MEKKTIEMTIKMTEEEWREFLDEIFFYDFPDSTTNENRDMCIEGTISNLKKQGYVKKTIIEEAEETYSQWLIRYERNQISWVDTIATLTTLYEGFKALKLKHESDVNACLSDEECLEKFAKLCRIKKEEYKRERARFK